MDVIKDLQKYYPIFDEGYGTEYERFALNRFIYYMVDEYNISTVLEMPANGIMGIPGLKSLMFAKIGCDVTISHPSQEFLDNSKKIWDCLGLEANFVKSHWINSIFPENSYDLVWNFCVYEHFTNPQDVIKEMLRVTNKYVFLEMQNAHNLGIPFHRLYHSLKRTPWDHGDVEKMKIFGLKNIVSGLNGSVSDIDIGATDMPPWPDINIGLKEMLSAKNLPTENVQKANCGELRPNCMTKEIDEVIREINSFEKSKITDQVVYYLFNIWYNFIEKKVPFILKRFFAHHPYIIVKKHG